MTHVFGIAAVVALFLLCTLLPFLPGRYDSLAVPLAVLARVLGGAGLLIVPAAAAWLISKRRGAAVATLLVACVVVFGISFAVTALIAVSQGVVLAAAGLWLVLRMARHVRGLAAERTSILPRYLVAVPLLVFLLQWLVVPRAVEFSRARAMRNAAPLIADIEQFRVTHGRYPSSLIGLWPDYWPGVRGIGEYRYEPSGDAYNLLFEQFAVDMATRELVVYNPLDQQHVTSHAMDRVRWTPEQVSQRRTFYAVHDAAYPHWKYFWFD